VNAPAPLDREIAALDEHLKPLVASAAPRTTQLLAVSTLIIETDPQAIQSDRLVILHHEGDLLTAGAPAAANSRKSPAQEVILHPRPDRTTPPPRWFRAKSA
jgi:hypothetical protein